MTKSSSRLRLIFCKSDEKARVTFASCISHSRVQDTDRPRFCRIHFGAIHGVVAQTYSWLCALGSLPAMQGRGHPCRVSGDWSRVAACKASALLVLSHQPQDSSLCSLCLVPLGFPVADSLPTSLIILSFILIQSPSCFSFHLLCWNRVAFKYPIRVHSQTN